MDLVYLQLSFVYGLLEHGLKEQTYLGYVSYINPFFKASKYLT